jgi:hypothetical protein
LGGRTARNAEPVDPAIGTTHMCQCITECGLLTGTRSAEGIMASGHANRINRPNTWLHRPVTQREVLTCQPGAVHTWHQVIAQVGQISGGGGGLHKEMCGVAGMSHLLDFVVSQKKAPNCLMQLGRSEALLARCAGRESGAKRVTSRLDGGTRHKRTSPEATT